MLTTTSFFVELGLFFAGTALAGRVCFNLETKRTSVVRNPPLYALLVYLEALRTGLTSVLGSRLALLSLRSLLADDTPLELLVRFPLVGGAGLSFDLNNLSLSSMELEFLGWELAW